MQRQDPEPRTILTAERDRNVRELQRCFLERAGFTVRMSAGNVHADHILGGGLPSNSIDIIMGRPGFG